MSPTRPIVPIVLSLFLAALLAASPTPAAASGCGGAYVKCLADSGALGSSDQLHETECYAEYLRCVGRALRVY